MDLGSVDLGSVDLGSVDLGSVDLGSVDLGSVDLGSAGLLVDTYLVYLGSCNDNNIFIIKSPVFIFITINYSTSTRNLENFKILNNTKIFTLAMLFITRSKCLFYLSTWVYFSM
ncbi:MAG: hypothetical protein ACYDBX_01410 [Patescibacteria group bacterium]